MFRLEVWLGLWCSPSPWIPFWKPLFLALRFRPPYSFRPSYFTAAWVKPRPLDLQSSDWPVSHELPFHPVSVIFIGWLCTFLDIGPMACQPWTPISPCFSDFHWLTVYLPWHRTYWAIQAGLLTPLTFAWHRLSPLAAFTFGAYFLHNGRRWQWILEFYTANFKGIFGGP